MSKSIFREKSLERLSSPERLDQLLRVVRRRSWLPLLITGGGLALAVAWSIAGRVPVTARGTAVLVHPRQVVAFQAPASGQLLTLDVRVGDVVARGQVLGTLNLPDLAKQLEQEEAKLQQFQARDRRLSDFERDQAAQEKKFLVERRRMIGERLAKLEEVAESMRAKNRAYIDGQRTNLATTKTLSEELGQALKERFESYLSLKEEGLSSDDAVVNARRGYIEYRLRLAELEVTRQELELREIQSEEEYLQRMDLVADLTLQLQDIHLKEALIDRRLLEASLKSTSEAEEIRRTIGRLHNQLATQGRVVAEHDGRILEIAASAGTFVSAGQRLGALEAEDPSSALVTLAYFPVSDGKRLRPGMRARISPSTVPAERYGSILGEVTAVSAYPVTTDAAANQVGNREMAQVLTGGGNRIEVFAAPGLDAATASGFRWTSGEGPDLAITAGTTAEISVTIEERAPITFVLPILRSWFGAS